MISSVPEHYAQLTFVPAGRRSETTPSTTAVYTLRKAKLTYVTFLTDRRARHSVESYETRDCLSVDAYRRTSVYNLCVCLLCLWLSP